MTEISHIAAAPRQFARFDVVIVGSGPSGSIVARTLAERGMQVCILEFGGLVSPGAIYDDHQAGFSRASTTDGSADGNPWTACCVGGGMQFYDAMTFRYNEADLRASRFLHCDLDPDWPICLDDLTPHYDEVERLLEVSGTHHFPAYPLTARGRRISEAMREVGVAPRTIPLAIRPPGAEKGCFSCSPCDERACPTDAKASVLARCLLRDDNMPGSITIYHGCFVEKIELDAEHHAHSLSCFSPLTSELIKIPVEVVVVCANAVQSAALMLRSKGPFARGGIGNHADLVGRGLSFKVSEYCVGYFSANAADLENFTAYRGPHGTVFTEDFYLHPEAPCGLGGLLYEANFVLPGENAGVVRLHFAAGEEPWSHNRVMLEERLDRHGLPIVRFEYKSSRNDLSRLDFLADQAERIIRRLGVRRISREPSGYAKGSAHLHGTMRAGAGPEHSVVAASGRVHGYDNIYVMDGSVMNFAGGANPTNTIMANARRMALCLSGEQLANA